MYEYLLTELSLDQILLAVGQVLNNVEIPEAHYLIFRRIAENKDWAIQNNSVLKPAIEQWFANDDTYAFRSQPCFQLYWGLKCAEIIGLEKPNIDCDGDSVLYVLLKCWGCDKPDEFIFPLWSDDFFKIVNYC